MSLLKTYSIKRWLVWPTLETGLRSFLAAVVIGKELISGGREALFLSLVGIIKQSFLVPNFQPASFVGGGGAFKCTFHAETLLSFEDRKSGNFLKTKETPFLLLLKYNNKSQSGAKINKNNSALTNSKRGLSFFVFWQTFSHKTWMQLRLRDFVGFFSSRNGTQNNDEWPR